MQFDLLGDLNWLAVLVAALAYFFLGAIWFAPPVFGKTWQRASGFRQPEGGSGPGAAAYVGPLITCLLSTIATAMIAVATGASSVSDGLVLGLVVGVGFGVAIVGTGAIFETEKPEKSTWFLINAGYHVVGLVLAAVILAVWE